MTNNRERLKQVLVIIATIGVVSINYLAGIGYINNITPAEIAAKYPTLITPAGYAFSIWGLIYLGLLAFSIYQALPRNTELFRPLRTVYILSCAANCAWIYGWHHELIPVCLGIIIILLSTLVFINARLRKTETDGEYWLAKFPFGIYFGWVTAATILNATVMLVYFNVALPDSTNVILGTILIFVASAFGVIICLKLRNYFYPLAVAWALTAIAVKHSEQTLIVAAAAVGVSACLIAALSFVLHMPSAKIR